MDEDLLKVLLVAGAAALGSLAGGAIALLVRATSLVLSLAVGFAGGVLLGAISFEMVPRAREASGILATAAAFALGLALVYALDLFINRGAVAGERADQKPTVEALHRRRPPRGSEVSVLAGGTSAEELIEGLAIGVSLAVSPSLGLLVGLAVAIDNVSEALSIGELARAESGDRLARRVLGWTGLIGVAVFSSAMAGWFFLRDLPPAALGGLLGLGAGGMFYLTVTDLVPTAEAHQFQQSAAIAVAAGFLLMFALAQSS
jgi:ZIP family zinc transporter